jgi:hypothetical protein
MNRHELPLRDLPTLPFTTLSVLAMQVSRDIDDGQDDKRLLLEEIFEAMQHKL